MFKNETDFKVDPPFDEDSDQTSIVLLEHGGCSLIEKVWNAQMFGFSAAIVIDDDATDFVELRKHGFRKHIDEVKGSAISIPFYKIFSIDGEKLVNYIKDDLPAYANKYEGEKKTYKWAMSSIVLELNTVVGGRDNRVEYEMWYSSVFDMSVKQIEEIADFQKPFGNHTLFTPRILTFACETCPKFIKDTACFSDGKYCAYQPKSPDYATYNGLNSDRDLLYEALREKCLYQKNAEDDTSKNFKMWFNYM